MTDTNQRWSVGRAPWYDGAPKPLVIGVTGGSASGKTSVCQAIVSHLNVPWVGLLSMDRYYKVLEADEVEVAHKGLYNFDHPDAFDVDRLYNDIVQLKEGKAVDVPIYDFCTHSRTPQTDRMYGVDIVIVEGILLFYAPKVRELLDLKIYVDTDNDLRLARRIRRDIIERGRSVDNVLSQYQRTVKPSFEQFIQPTKAYADLIIPWNDSNYVAVDILTQHIRTKLEHRQRVCISLPSNHRTMIDQNDTQFKINNSVSSSQSCSKCPSCGYINNQIKSYSSNDGSDTIAIVPLDILGNSVSNVTRPSSSTSQKSPFLAPQDYNISKILIHSPSLRAVQVEMEDGNLAPISVKQSLPVLMNPAEATARLHHETHIHPQTSKILHEDQEEETIHQQPHRKYESSDIVVENHTGKYTSGFNRFDFPDSLNKSTDNKIQELRALHQDSFVRHNASFANALAEDARITKATVLYPANFPQNLLVLPPTKSLTAIHTTLRNKKSSIIDFRFALERLVRILCSEAMNLVSYVEKTVTTPNAESFHGLACESANVVAVSIVRAGEAFEESVREVVKDIAIGKIIIDHQPDKSTGPRYYHAKLPIVSDSKIKILLFDGVLATGSAVIMAIHVLLDHGADPAQIIFCCTTATPEGIYNLTSAFPQVQIVTSSLEQGLDEHLFCIPGLGSVGHRYFGSEPTAEEEANAIKNAETANNLSPNPNTQ